MESRGELAVVDDPQIHVHSATQHNTGFGLAFACDSLDGGLAGEYVHNFAPDFVASGVVNAHYHVNISYRLAATAQTTRYLMTHNLWDCCQYGLNTCCLFFC